MRVVRHTPAFDAACRFYGEVLGWPVTREWDTPARGRIFGYGDVGRIELIEAGAAVDVEGVFVAVEHPGVERLADLLADWAGELGLEIFQPVAVQPWGHRNVGVTDPTGLRVVFFEWV